MRILLAIDDSSCSTAAANTLAAQFTPSTTHVDVLHVDDWPSGLPPSIAFAPGPAAADSVLALHQAHRDRSAALLASIAERLRREGFSASASIRDGDPRRTIIECAKEWHADLIVLGSHDKHGIERMLGSVSESVARHAPCSVQIVRPLAAAA
jgi:nucleotide-binding universal stress UspA family protein